MQPIRLAVLGAGPIGIEAALAALEKGWQVHVYERGSIGDNIARWGHVRLFSPFALNHSRRGAELVSSKRVLPSPDDYLTGAEHLDSYLLPLASTTPLAECVHQHCRVVSVGRDRIGKGSLIGGPREQHPFRLLIDNDAGEETLVEADVIFDCTGTYGNHNWMGNGNVPAKGERRLEADIAYGLAEPAETERRVLVVGDGYSAATTLSALRSKPDIRVDWVARSKTPLEPIPDDPLPERARLSVLACELARGGDCRFRFRPESTVESVKRDGQGFELELRSTSGLESIRVDRIYAHVGFHPDNTIYRELQIHECYASAAPMKLAAALLGEGSADCLAQTSKGAEALRSPEPNFFILGSKSYGRGSNFLMRIGLQQVDEALSLFPGKPSQSERVS